MRLNYTNDGPYKVMAARNNLVIIFQRYNTISEALYVLDYHTGPNPDNFNSYINKEWELWLEV